MSYNGLQWVFNELRRWLEAINQVDRELEKNEEEALRSFLRALNETTIYLGRIRNNPEQSTREGEENLSRLWTDAAQKVRHYNSDLSARCLAKATYWADQKHWEAYELDNTNISINEMLKIANSVINKAGSRGQTT